MISSDQATGTRVDGIYLNAPEIYNNGRYGFYLDGPGHVINVYLTNPAVSGNSSETPGGYPGISIQPNMTKFYIQGGFQRPCERLRHHHDHPDDPRRPAGLGHPGVSRAAATIRSTTST